MKAFDSVELEILDPITFRSATWYPNRYRDSIQVDVTIDTGDEVFVIDPEKLTELLEFLVKALNPVHSEESK